jgi:hypothetical protein
MDSTLEYILLDACEFLLLRPFVPDAYDCRCGVPPGTFDRGPESLPWVIDRGGRGRQVVKSCLPVLIVGWRSDGVDCS